MKMSACTVKHRKHMKNSDTDTHYRYPAYRCQRRINGHDCCNTKQYYEKTIERKLLSMIKPELEKYIVSYDVIAAPVVNNVSKRKSIEKKKGKLKELFINDLISLDEYKMDKAKYDEELTNLQINEVPQKDLTYVRQLLSYDIESLYITMNVNEKNRFWRSFLNEIQIDNNHNIKLIFR